MKEYYFLYNSKGETVLFNNTYEALAEYLGRTIKCCYTIVSMVKQGKRKHIYGKNGNKYTLEFVKRSDNK